jgi:hypothetical protein
LAKAKAQKLRFASLGRLVFVHETNVKHPKASILPVTELRMEQP